MKTVFNDRKTKVLLDEKIGTVYLVRGEIYCSSENDGIIIRADGYKEQEIQFNEKEEYSGLEISFHCGSWDWVPGQIVPK